MMEIMQCQHLGLNYIRGNHSHISEPQSFIRFHNHQARGRIRADGNCFFTALALLITESQEDLTEMCALITSYVSHNADKFSSYLKEDDESMNKYLKTTKMDALTVWASELKIFAAAQMLQTSIFVYAISRGQHKWLKHASIINVIDSISQHCQEAIYMYITNTASHYETVKRV